MKKFYKDYRDIIRLIIAFIIFFFTSLIISIPLSLLGITIKEETTEYYLLTVAINVLRCLFLVILFRKDLIKDFKPFKKNFWKYMDTAVKFWLIGILVMAVSNILIMLFSPAKVANNEQGIKTMINAIPILSLILTGITAPVSEEILFRRAFRNAIKDKITFVIISGFVFGALHVVTSYQTPFDLLYIIPYSSCGVAFAATCAKTENVFPSMLVHSVHNSAATIANIFMGMII